MYLCIAGNYRPISLLPSISNIFERALYEQLYKYFTTNNLFHHIQYGFRREHSTDLAAPKLIDGVTSIKDKGKIAIAIFLNFSKASDRLNHKIFLTKLS